MVHVPDRCSGCGGELAGRSVTGIEGCVDLDWYKSSDFTPVTIPSPDTAAPVATLATPTGVVGPVTLAALQAHRWPGNVRELKNLLERLMILSPAESIRREDLPAEIVQEARDEVAEDAPLREARDDFERRYILAALRRFRGNVTRAAEALEVERSNLYRKLKSYGIEVERE